MIRCTQHPQYDGLTLPPDDRTCPGCRFVWDINFLNRWGAAAQDLDKFFLPGQVEQIREIMKQFTGKKG